MAISNVMPEFKNPPVSEVALSVEFTALENWSSSHALLFWASIREEYPLMELQQPLLSEIERFGPEFWQPPQVKFEMMDQNSNRFWFMTDPSNWLIQIQRDRFVLNWRKVSGNEEYPRYNGSIRDRFIKELNRFLKFIEDNNVGNLRPTQCEVTYVNDILRGDYWNSVSEATSLFSSLNEDKPKAFLPEIESISISSSYLMPDQKGRLRFSISHALRNIDKKEVIKMNLVARGRPSSHDSNAIIDWIDTGREWIVRGFEDLTTEKAHKLWGKK